MAKKAFFTTPRTKKVPKRSETTETVDLDKLPPPPESSKEATEALQDHEELADVISNDETSEIKWDSDHLPK